MSLLNGIAKRVNPVSAAGAIVSDLWPCGKLGSAPLLGGIHTSGSAASSKSRGNNLVTWIPGPLVTLVLESAACWTGLSQGFPGACHGLCSQNQEVELTSQGLRFSMTPCAATPGKLGFIRPGALTQWARFKSKWSMAAGFVRPGFPARHALQQWPEMACGRFTQSVVPSRNQVSR